MDFSYFDSLINGTDSKASRNQITTDLTRGKEFTIESPTSYRTETIAQNRNKQGRFESGYHATSAPEISEKYGDSKTRTNRNFGVESTAVQSARYDPNDNSLNITYKGGDKEYKFAAEPQDVMDWINAPSKGRLTQEWKETHRYPGY